MNKADEFIGCDLRNLLDGAAAVWEFMAEDQDLRRVAGITEHSALLTRAKIVAVRADLTCIEQRLVALFSKGHELDGKALRTKVQPLIRHLRSIGDGLREKGVLPRTLFDQPMRALRKSAT